MVEAKDAESSQHWERLKNIEDPFVREWITMNSAGEFDQAVDGANLGLVSRAAG